MEKDTPSILQVVVNGAVKLLSSLSFLNIAGCLVVICVLTRVLTQIFRFRSKYPDGSIEPTIVPYWVPFLGHWLSLGLSRQRVLQNIRLPKRGAALRFYCWGTRHIILTTPSLAKGLSTQRDSTSSEPCANYLMDNVFGSSRKLRKPEQEDAPRTETTEWRRFLTDKARLKSVSSLLVREIEQATPNLVSFTSSVVDQSPWERSNRMTVIDHVDGGGSACEADLYSLIRDFVGFISTNLIMGKSLMEFYPNILPDLWEFNDKFKPMLLGIPRWIPYPGLPTAYLARRKLLTCLTVFNIAFARNESDRDPGIDWRYMDDVSEVVQARARARINQGFSAEFAASEDLSLLWATNVRTNALIFWNLINILSDSDLHTQLMKEITPYAKLIQSTSRESGFSFPEPPRLSLDYDNIVKSCPLLKATQEETVRLYSSSFTFRKVTSDFNLTESELDARDVSRDPCTYRLSAGDYVGIPNTLRDLSPDHVDSPDKFNPQRFLKKSVPNEDGNKASDSSSSINSDEGAPIMAENEKKDGSIGNQELEEEDNSNAGWPWRWDDPDSNIWVLEDRKVLVFIAAFLTMWHIEPAKGKKGWKVPGSKGGSLVDEPKRDIRVRLRTRA